MIVGNSQRFAIEVEPEEILDGWLLGRFRFWIGGEAIGNWDDAADLRGCARWLAEFAAHPKDRYERQFDRASAEEIMRAVCDERGVRDNPLVEDVDGRFYISRLGMSSFDAVDLLLVFTADGGERCIWREARTARLLAAPRLR
jgi:hypothetical protein